MGSLIIKRDKIEDLYEWCSDFYTFYNIKGKKLYGTISAVRNKNHYITFQEYEFIKGVKHYETLDEFYNDMYDATIMKKSKLSMELNGN